MPQTPLGQAKFFRGDKVVLDTNILVFLHAGEYQMSGQTPSHAAPYTEAFRKLLIAEAEVILLDVVVGEFFKVLESKASAYWCRRNLGSADGKQDLKEFRKRGPHTKLVTDFQNAINGLMKRGGSFQRTNITGPGLANLGDQLKASRADFNDLLIARHAIEKQAMLLSSDKDMTAFSENSQLELVQG